MLVVKKSLYKKLKKSLLNKPVTEVKEIKKSFDDMCDEIIEKANNWGRKIPMKKQTADGRMITYWVNPEDINQGTSRGQQNLFSDRDMNGGYKKEEEGFFSNWDMGIYEHRIKPMIENFKKVESVYPGISKRIENKYKEYKWDRDTRDLDMELDEKTLEYLQRVIRNKAETKHYRERYEDETNKLCKQINNRKIAMARIKNNQKVQFNGQPAKVTGFNARGYPEIELNDGTKKNCFVDEIANIDELIEKFSKSA